MFGKALDRAALACCIAPFKEQYKFLACLLNPVLHLQQFNLKRGLFCLISRPGKFDFIRVFTLFKTKNRCVAG